MGDILELTTECRETEEEFLDSQLVSVIYSKPNGNGTIQSLRIMKNINFELHPCSKNIDLAKPIQVAIIQADH